MERERERTIGEDWAELARLAGAVRHRPWTFLFVLSTTAALVLAALLARPAFHTSHVTLRLEGSEERDPLERELLLPAGTGEAELAAAEATSAAVLARVVAGPADGSVAAPGAPGFPQHLGLETEVRERDAQGLATRVRELLGLRSEDFRLYAALEPATPGALGEVRVRFLDDTRVEVRVPEDAPAGFGPAGARLVAEHVDGEPLALGDLQLRLVVRGRPDGRTFLVERVHGQDAAARLAARVATTPARDAELLTLSVTHDDPRRAAELAGGLAAALAAVDRERTLERASTLRDHLASDLDAERRALEELDATIEELAASNPDALDVVRASARLGDHRTVVATRLGEVRSLRRSLELVLAGLASDDRAAASRLGTELDDPLTRRYLEYVARLEEERLRVGAHDSGDYQETIRLEREQALERLARARLDLEALRGLVEDLEAGETAALARLATAPTPPGFVSVDEVTLRVATDALLVEREISELAAEFREGYPPLVARRAELARLRANLLDHARAQEPAREAVVRAEEAFVEHWSGLALARPEEERARIDAALEVLWDRVEAGVAARVVGLRQNERELEDELGRLDRSLARLPAVERRLEEARRERAARSAIALEATARLHDAELALDTVRPSVTRLGPPTLPGVELAPRLALGAVLGLLLGTLLAFGSVAAIEGRRGGMRGPRDYEEIGLLGTVPIGETGDGGELDAYRAARARLRGRTTAAGEPLRVLGVTSCRGGEGKTDAAVGLGLVYALEGLDVLLIDGNLRDPRLAEIFEAQPSAGLAAALDGREGWMDALRPTGIAGLDLLPAGDSLFAPGDLLGGVAMQAVLEEMLHCYDLVLVDLPAVEGSADVECVAGHLDGLVLVTTEEEGPTRRELQDVLRRVEEAAGTWLGVLRRPVARRAIDELEREELLFDALAPEGPGRPGRPEPRIRRAA